MIIKNLTFYEKTSINISINSTLKNISDTFDPRSNKYNKYYYKFTLNGS